MTTRESVGPKVRFGIFKRDNFTCVYCGRKTPQVILEVDHVIPASRGGGNEPENLVTSCWECNRGKGADLLSETDEGRGDMHASAVLMAEREMQLAEYNAVRQAVRERVESDLAMLNDYWVDVTNGRASEIKQSVLRFYLQTMPREDIADAMIVAARKNLYGTNAVKYLVGVLRSMSRNVTERHEASQGVTP